MLVRSRNSERGVSLIIVLLVMMLLSALMIAFMANIMADTRSSGTDRDETQAYAVAHAGMEKLTSDLAALFSSDYSPSGDQISAVAAKVPVMTGFTYTDPDGSTGYKVTFTASVSGVNTPVQTPTSATPVPDDPTTGTTIAAGPYQGFKGLVTHYNIMVTARSTGGGSEMRMRRELQTVAVPVFQFGVFSESSLSFHAGADFTFGGRVHTNGNLFLTAGNGNTLTLGDKVTALGEVVRKYLDNGFDATSNWNGNVSMAKGTGVYRDLAVTEGSVINGLPAGGAPCLTTTTPACQNENTWTNLSVGTYNGYIRNGRTGARRLDLPLVTYGAQPVDLIRRPPPPAPCPTTVKGEDTCTPLVYNQRYYQQAALRILLSDTAADITSLPNVTGSPVSLEAVAGTACANPAGCFGPTGKQTPLATSDVGGNYRSLAGTPLIGGYIKIDMQKADGTWVDVTSDILALGITGKNISSGVENTAFTGSPDTSLSGTIRAAMNTCLGQEIQANAVVRLQRVKDVPSTGSTYRYNCASTSAGVPSNVSTDYWPLALYDPREGVKRGENGNNDPNQIGLSGVMYYVELDTNNLARWFRGTIGTQGTLARNDNNGYIVYFSDRRNNRNASSAETGEFGDEDIVNPASTAGTPNGTLDAGEDVNASTLAGYTPVLDIYGARPNYLGTYNTAPPAGTVNSPLSLSASRRVNDIATSATDATSAGTVASIVRGNRPLFFRRALKLTNGGSLQATGITGLTIASENPVYVQGNYNASSTDATSGSHIASAIIADAIVLLSNQFNDINSFKSDVNDSTNNGLMDATDTGYRFAAVLGKSISFPRPTGYTGDNDFGDDGGVHNLLRFLEDWGSRTATYRGSLVSFFIARQATGIYKSGVYGPPATRNYTFDTDFLLPTGLPPGSPMFRDVNTLTFRQLLRPNQ